MYEENYDSPTRNELSMLMEANEKKRLEDKLNLKNFKESIPGRDPEVLMRYLKIHEPKNIFGRIKYHFDDNFRKRYETVLKYLFTDDS